MDSTERMSITRSWLHAGSHAWNVGDSVSTSLSLPAGADNVKFEITGCIVTPTPLFGIDRLSNQSKDLETAEVMLFGEFLAKSHQGANGHGGSAEMG